MNETPDRRERPRTPGNFKNAEDATYKILREHERGKMEFRIEKINSKYVIFDQDGAAYGSYDNKADVEVAI